MPPTGQGKSDPSTWVEGTTGLEMEGRSDVLHLIEKKILSAYIAKSFYCDRRTFFHMRAYSVIPV